MTKIIKITTKSETIVKVDDEDIEHFDGIAEMIKGFSPQLQKSIINFEIVPDDTTIDDDWTADAMEKKNG